MASFCGDSDYKIFDHGAENPNRFGGQRQGGSLRNVIYERQSSSFGGQSRGVLRAIFNQPTKEELEDLSHKHSFVYVMLHHMSKEWQSEVFKKCITTLIFFDLVAFVLSTEQAIYAPNVFWFRLAEGISAVIFLIEYCARIATIVENDKYGGLGPVLGRLRWMISYPAMIDFFATAPFFVQLATGYAIPPLSSLRVFRVLRILKTDGYARAFSACYRVIYYNREILWVAVLVCLFLVLFSSMLLYYLRPRNDYEKDEFRSIPSTIYVSVLMLTGQDSWIKESEGMPWYTKLVVGFTGGLSVAMFAIPVSLLTLGFEAEAERCAKKARKVIKRAKSSSIEQSTHEVPQVSSMNSDEEYQKIIAKESSGIGLDDSKRSAKLKQLLETFLEDDEDGRNHIALSDFLANFYHLGNTSLVSHDIGHDTLVHDVADLQHRMINLEYTMTDINSKMDTICNLLLDRKHTDTREVI